jgi:hypothetical protein
LLDYGRIVKKREQSFDARLIIDLTGEHDFMHLPLAQLLFDVLQEPQRIPSPTIIRMQIKRVLGGH